MVVLFVSQAFFSWEDDLVVVFIFVSNISSFTVVLGKMIRVSLFKRFQKNTVVLLNMIQFDMNIFTTLPKFNISLKIGLPKRKLVFQPSIFRGYVKLPDWFEATTFIDIYRSDLQQSQLDPGCPSTVARGQPSYQSCAALS